MGLGCNIRQVTPESRYETFPVTGGTANLWLAGTARLDDREELCRRLGIHQVEWPTTPDTTLLMSAYERWGDAVRIIFGATGPWPFGISGGSGFPGSRSLRYRGLYYYRDFRLLAFASAMKGLLALPRCRRR